MKTINYGIMQHQEYNMEEQAEYNAGKKKELRIAIYETPDEIIEGGYGDFYSTIDRKTAIEKMAKALAFVQAKTFVDKNQWEIVMRGCRYEAEAALNALSECK